MAAKRSSSLNESDDRETVITRVFDAPRKLVWKAWTEPERLMRWLGPKYFTSPSCKIDLRVGGKYLFCMRSPEGQEFWNTGVYREIVEPEEILVTVTFEEHDGKTRMTLRLVGLPPEMGEMAGAGWNCSLDKLADAVGKEKSI
ncbi:MAG: SRPBCC domain-containing protein [Chloracidobacterium sp.]|nr:SRPBCC domain-containing protein [Chloracidobacterium sp.]